MCLLSSFDVILFAFSDHHVMNIVAHVHYISRQKRCNLDKHQGNQKKGTQSQVVFEIWQDFFTPHLNTKDRCWKERSDTQREEDKDMWR